MEERVEPGTSGMREFFSLLTSFALILAILQKPTRTFHPLDLPSRGNIPSDSLGLCIL